LKSIDAGDFVAAWGGIASLQLGLCVVWTGAGARGLSLDQVATWLAAAPARLAGLTGRKGAIEAGRDADFVFFDPEPTAIVEPSNLQHRHPLTPYAGMALRGRVHQTILRGEVIFDEGRFPGAPSGRALLRG
jgi:allantoinase